MSQWKGRPYPLRVEIVLYGYSQTGLAKAMDSLGKQFKARTSDAGDFNDPDRKGYGWNWRVESVDEVEQTWQSSLCEESMTPTAWAVTLSHKGKQYVVIDDYPKDERGARYMWEDGNYSCDCNRSMFIAEQCDSEFPDLGCGETIELIEMKAVLKGSQHRP